MLHRSGALAAVTIGLAACFQEFWRHNAGEYDDVLSGMPLVATIGNNCTYDGGGVGTAEPAGPANSSRPSGRSRSRPAPR